MDKALNCPTIVDAPTEREPWREQAPILSGSEILIVKKMGNEHTIKLPHVAKSVFLRDILTNTHGTYFDAAGFNVGGFLIDRQGGVIYDL